MALGQSLGFSSGELGRMLLAYLLVFSSCVTTVTSLIILYSDYKKERAHKDASLAQIELSYMPTLSQSLWDVDVDQLRLQLEGIKNFPYIAYVSVTGSEGEFEQVGNQNVLQLKEGFEQYEFDLNYQRSDEWVQIGRLKVVADVNAIYQTIYDRALMIIATQFIKTMLVSIFVLFIVHHLITRHMETLARWARAANLEMPVQLVKKPERRDELDQVVDSLNAMRSLVIQSMEQRDHALAQLEESNRHLEEKVDERTAELLEVIEQLNESYNHLSATKRQLVETEKMAEMGSMVAGVAHELNTPLGVCVTLVSLLQCSVDDMMQKKSTTGVTREDFESFLKQLHDSVRMMQENVARASRIVKSFKRLAIKKSSTKLVTININELLASCVADEVLNVSEEHVQFELDCPESLTVESYEGILDTVVLSLVHNSVEHGIASGQNDDLVIRIAVKQEGDTINLNYEDSGKGLTAEAQKYIFDPFYTTTRHKGNVGLGMHLTYNLVTQILNGTIESLPAQPDQNIGAHFVLRFPANVHGADQ